MRSLDRDITSLKRAEGKAQAECKKLATTVSTRYSDHLLHELLLIPVLFPGQPEVSQDISQGDRQHAQGYGAHACRQGAAQQRANAATDYCR